MSEQTVNIPECAVGFVASCRDDDGNPSAVNDYCNAEVGKDGMKF